MATRLFYLVVRLSKVATSLNNLVLSCIKVVEGGYKFVQACINMIATTLFTALPSNSYVCRL